MGEAKFTKYKWVVEPDEEYGEPALMITAAGLDIATLWGGYNAADADANLIMAAPDMYEALKEVAERLRNCASNIEEEYPIWAGDLRKMAESAAAAIAKSEGKT